MELILIDPETIGPTWTSEHVDCRSELHGSMSSKAVVTDYVVVLTNQATVTTL